MKIVHVRMDSVAVVARIGILALSLAGQNLPASMLPVTVSHGVSEKRRNRPGRLRFLNLLCGSRLRRPRCILTPGRYTFHGSVQSQLGAGFIIPLAQLHGVLRLVAEDAPEPASCVLVGAVLVFPLMIRRQVAKQTLTPANSK
ncbi:MAG: hypothetical protein ACRD8O_24520 [Bryobacteraceae bacterium]